MMNQYQKYWNNKIEKLIKQLDASEELHTTLSSVLGNSNLTQIFPNQIINALNVAYEIQQGAKNIALVASMQSGKSGTIYTLCNYILPALGLIKKGQSVVFVTSMRDTDLFEQNKINLEKEFFCFAENRYKQSFIHVVKMNGFFKYPNPHKIVQELNVKLIVRDEDQYGCGQESSFDTAFFRLLRSKMPNIKLLAVSATPYDILDAKFNGADVEVIAGERPQKYFGISEMLDLGLIEDYPTDFKPVIDDNYEKEIHPKLSEYIDHLNSFEDGLGIIRVSSTTAALRTRDCILKEYKSELECIAIGSSPDCDYSIKDGLAKARTMVLTQQKRVVVIVVHALSAGKDLGLLKEKMRFGIESRNRQLANGAQGIAGRVCGYHDNRNCKIMASTKLLKHYSEFEHDWEIFADERWRDELYNQNVTGLTTHTRLQLNRREGIFTPIQQVDYYTPEDLSDPDVRNELSFIDDRNYEKLLNCFKEEFYNTITKGFRLNQEGVTVRIASSYNPESNRVYKNWFAGLKNDFGSVFFKKNNYEYGLLLSNFPDDDERNKIGVCGVKIFKSGIPFLATQDTSVYSTSMYAEREEEITEINYLK